jgi:hypothetical protein
MPAGPGRREVAAERKYLQLFGAAGDAPGALHPPEIQCYSLYGNPAFETWGRVFRPARGGDLKVGRYAIGWAGKQSGLDRFSEHHWD